MGQLEPSLCKGVGKFLRIFLPTLCDFPEARVFTQRDIGCEHDGRVTDVRTKRIWYHIGGSWVTRDPLGGACWAFGFYPFKIVQIVQILRRERDWV